jgi:peptidoglycan/LPS O-acetylase OafA/YrhL
MTGGRLAGLDALRGIAALCVLVYHAAGQGSSNAYLSVDFFFMLSGYVMARTYEPRLASGMTPGQFLRTRVGKLWPTMFLASLVALPWLFSWVPPAWAWPIALANLLLIPTMMQNRLFLLNGPAWSILFELGANAVHALGLWRAPNKLLILLILLAGSCLAWFGSTQTLELGSRPGTVLGGVARVLTSYSIGMLLWRLWLDRPPIAVSSPFTLLAMPIFFGIGALLGGQSWQSDLLFVLLLCPMLIAGGLEIGKPHRWLAWLGEISFPLYAVHGPVLRTSEWLGPGNRWGALASVPIAWCVMRLARRFENACRQLRLRAASKAVAGAT